MGACENVCRKLQNRYTLLGLFPGEFLFHNTQGVMPTMSMAETVRGAQATLGTIGEARAQLAEVTSGRRHACELADAESF